MGPHIFEGFIGNFLTDQTSINTIFRFRPFKSPLVEFHSQTEKAFQPIRGVVTSRIQGIDKLRNKRNAKAKF
jgi:hypothetical protein